jgi:hypothetical protein
VALGRSTERGLEAAAVAHSPEQDLFWGIGTTLNLKICHAPALRARRASELVQRRRGPARRVQRR